MSAPNPQPRWQPTPPSEAGWYWCRLPDCRVVAAQFRANDSRAWFPTYVWAPHDREVWGGDEWSTRPDTVQEWWPIPLTPPEPPE